MSLPHAPPRLLRWLLARAVPRDGASGDSLAGDLFQEYRGVRDRRGRLRADVWYASQVVALAVPFLLREAVAMGGDLASRTLAALRLELRHTARGLLRTPGTTAVAILSLALGIGMVVTSAGIIAATWFTPLPYPEADRLVELGDTHPVEVCATCTPGTSHRSYREWAEDLPAFEKLGAMAGREAVLGEPGNSRTIRVAAVTWTLADLLGVEPRIGRALRPEDEVPGAAPVVLLGHHLWEAAYGSDPGVVGNTVRLDGVPHTVLGVLGEDAHLPDRSQAWVALGAGSRAGGYGDRGVRVLGRLAPGVSAGAAEDALAALASARYDADPELSRGWSARLERLDASLARGAPNLAAAVALQLSTLTVLLIACLNLASLLLARTTERERELGIRVAVGSSRGGLIRFVALESAVLAAVGGAAGTALAVALLGALDIRTRGLVPGWMDFSPGAEIWGMGVAVAATAAVACGLLPGLSAGRLARGSRGRLGQGAGHRRLLSHDWLLGAQTALGLFLLAGTATSVHTFARVSDLGTLGLRTDGVAILRVASRDEDVEPAADEGALWQRVSAVRTALESHPGVRRAVPVSGVRVDPGGTPGPVRVEGAGEPHPRARSPRAFTAVGPGYMDLMGIRLLAGREIGDTDAPGAPGVAVVSAEAGWMLWPEAAPGDLPGRRFALETGDATLALTVVGVVGDVVRNYRNPDRGTEPRVYLSLGQVPPALLSAGTASGANFQLEVGDGPPPVSELNELLTRAEPGLRAEEVLPLEMLVRDSIAPIRVTAQLSGALAAVALTLVVLGVYATLSYRVASQRREIGVRVALGARLPALVRSLTSRLARVSAIALAVGAALALPVGWATEGSELPVGGAPLTVLAAALSLAAVMALACAAPLRRASRVDPMESLRAE